MIPERALKTLLELEKESLISNKKEFSITLELISRYIEIYSGLGITKNKNKFDIRLAKKIAAMNLVKYKKKHKLLCKEGFAYIISNPAWPNTLKVGMSTDVHKRLNSYQTYSPNRDYKLEWFGFWFDAKAGELALRSCFNTVSHEWVYNEDVEPFKHLADIY